MLPNFSPLWDRRQITPAPPVPRQTGRTDRITGFDTRTSRWMDGERPEIDKRNRAKKRERQTPGRLDKGPRVTDLSP